MDRVIKPALQKWLQILVIMLVVLQKSESFFLVNITYVPSAVAKGAVCLDGSPPAYHLDIGSGSGANNWLIEISSGGWCNNVTSCLDRSKGPLGSSTVMEKQLNFSGLLSNESQFNPNFYNWNRIKMRYCDGASFTGDVKEVDPVTNLHYRGARIFPAVIRDILKKGMRNAENAILSGCSAGGLTSFHHCDKFRALLPKRTKVKCIADAGFFINAKDITGAPHIEEFFNDVVTLHGSAKHLPKSCTSKMKPSLCFFPENIAQGIKTPLFIINSPYDSWQISYILVHAAVDPQDLWHDCKSNLQKCNATQLQIIQGFRSDFVNKLTALGASPSTGYFINSCHLHCQAELQDLWFGSIAPLLNNKTMAEAVADWFYERCRFHEIDCPYPCNKSCPVELPILREDKDTSA